MSGLVWFVVIAAVVGGLVLLGLSLVPIVTRLKPLARAAQRAEARVAEAEQLQGAAEALQERVEALEQRMGDLQVKIARVRS